VARRLRILTVLAALAATLPLRAATLDIPEVSLTLPDGWVEVPQEILQQFYEEMQRQAPDAGIPRYDYAVQSSDGPPWLAYPYVLVKISITGRPTERELQAMPRIDANAELQKKSEALSKVMTDTKLGQMQYDKAANVVWVTSESDVVGIGKVSGLSGVIPTEKGFVQLHGYARSEDFARHEPVFRKIITTAKISPALVYQPRWSDELAKYGLFDSTDLRWRTGIGLAVGLVVLIFVLLRRKRA
jgi:hypothetical protein